MVAIFTGAGAGLARSSANILGGAGSLGNSGLGRGGESVSVNAATGNLLVGRQDEFLVGRGIDLALTRIYNSLADTTDGDNGDQWQFGTQRRVFGLTGTLNTAGSTVKRQSADGSVITYSWNAARNAYVTTDGDGAHDSLTNAGGIWTWTDGSSQVKETYAAYGTDNWRITAQNDTDGYSLAFTYLADKLDKVTTADGSWVQYSWSGFNVTQIVTGYTDLATSTAKTLTSTRYSYDASNRLSQVTTDLSPEDNAITDGKTYVTTYTYDGTSKRIASIAQTDGSNLAITYDGSGRVLTLTQTVAVGNTRVTSLTYGVNFTNVTGPDGQVTRLDYDAAKQLTKITAPPAFTGATAQTVQFAYDAKGNVTSITDAKGGITTYSYTEANYDPSVTTPVDQSGSNDANGNITKITYPGGITVERWYDAGNRVVRELTYGSDSTGASVAKNAHFAYDVEGHLRYQISPEGFVTEYRYTTYGQLQYSIEYPEHAYTVSATTPTEAQMDAWRNAITDRSSTKIKLYSYDARGNQTAVLDYGYANLDGSASTAEGYSRTYFTYDQSGRLISRYLQGEAAETFVYDGLDRIVASTGIAGGTSTFVFNDAATTTTVTTASGYVSTSTYNKAGELLSETHSGSYDVTGTSTNKYDKNGRLRQSTDALGYSNYYLYDNAGRKIADINHNGDVVEYRYDANNNVIATTRFTNVLTAAQLATLSNPDSVVEMSTIRPAAHSYDIWSWSVYNAAGQIVQSIDGDGGVAAFEYDASGRLVKTTSYYNKVSAAALKTTPPTTAVAVTANAAIDDISRNFYNRNGQMIGALDGEGYLSEVIYDKAGQKIEEVAYATATSSTLWASGTFAQLKSTAAPTSTSNRKVRYVYDGQGLLRYQVDMVGGVAGYTYDVAGKLTKTTAYAGTISTTDFTYDNVKALVAAIVNATNDRASTISYTASGLVASTVDAGGLTTSYVYDNLGRATKMVVGTGGSARTTYNYYTASGDLRFTVDPEGYVHRFDYDAEGRKTRDVTWNTRITVSDSTTIGQVNSLATGTWVDTSYTYDAAGRLNSQYDGEGNRTVYTWYANGALSSTYYAYGTADQSRDLYAYDGAGRLVSEYKAYGEAEQAIISYTYDGLGNKLTSTDPNGKVTSYSYDEVGRVVTVTNAAGGVTSYEYNAFGDVVKSTDARGNAIYTYYDVLGRVTKSRDAESYVTETSYTAFGEIASVTRRYNKTTSAVSTTTPPTVTAHAKDAVTSLQYDKMGRVTRTTDAEGHFETYTYDALGNRLSKTAKSATGSKVAGGTTTYVYDKRGALLSETLPMASYNNAGAAVSTSVTNSYEYDARGNRTKSIEASGLAEARTTQFVYDKANRLIETIGQTFLGQTPHEYIRYDARGNVTSTVDAAGARTVVYYDDLNRKSVFINAAGTYTKYTYDKVGNVTQAKVFETAVTVPADGGSEEEASGLPAGVARTTTFTYDNVNRMLTSSVTGATTGYWNGTSWVSSTTDITTSYQYDANGNVVKATDANGNAVWSYYDALGRRTAKVDGENYITTWTYDSDGNVLSERRYWNRAAAPSSTTTPPAVTANASLDRITDFTYDMVGNRTVEIRRNVTIHNGNGGTTTADAIVGYAYNGLSQVVRKTEATGDFVDYVYDAAGRLTLEARKAYTDFSGASVTPTVDYYYNGLNNLARTRQRGTANAAERVTTYGYDGDKLRWMTDAGGLTRYYWYDIAGRQTYDYYTRTKSDGSSAAAYDGVLTAYDALGRVSQKWQATYNGSSWIDAGPRAVTTYNAFSEVVSVAVGGVVQQQNKYDAAGRMWASNSGDGVWKYFGYDKNGNQTVAISSAGANLTGQSFAGALALAGQNDVNANYSVYDKRNQATSVVEEGRQFSVGGALQTLTTSRSYTAFGETATETNANGAVLTYTYNNMGRLIRSESPTIEITLENGGKQWIKPSEDYYYDISGRLVATRDANGSYAAGGTSAAGTSKAANTGNLTRLSLLTGSGYGGSRALIASETHADGGVKQTGYDIHGDARKLTDEINRVTTQTFDGMGRVTQVDHAGGLVNSYAYDGLGQLLKHWNNQLQVPVYGPTEQIWVEDYNQYGYYGGHWEDYTPIIGYTPDVETTDYDTMGRVVSQRTFGGDVTSYTYSWDASISTTGLGTFGGWTQVTTFANSKTATEKTDAHGRLTWKSDLGAHVTTYTYDVAGRQISSATGGMLNSFTYFNTGQIATMASGTSNAGQVNSNWDRKTATFSYDKVGNKLTETLVQETAVYTPGGTYWYNPYEPEWIPESYDVYTTTIKNQTSTYDALGRLKTWAEAGTSTLPISNISYEYDANGNVRRTYASYRGLTAQGAANGTATIKDYWFRYDSMNRVTTDKGQLSGAAGVAGTTIVRGANSANDTSAGRDILYDAAGQRIAVLTTNYQAGYQDYYYDNYGYYYGEYIPGYVQELRESYLYDSAGRLSQVQISAGATLSEVYDSGTGTWVMPSGAVPAAPVTGTRRSQFSYDLMGRQTLQQDYDYSGNTVVFSRSVTYNDKSQISSDYVSTKKYDNKTYTSSNSYDYGYGTNYALGSVLSVYSYSTVTGQSGTSSSTTNSYQWWDGAVQSSIAYKPNTSQSTTYNTTFYYNGLGQLSSVYIADGKPRSVSFTLDELGQIIRRDESQPSGQTGSPHEVWYRFSGRQLGYTGNNGTADVAIAQSISERQTVQPTNPGTFRNGQTYGIAYADFAQNYDPLNSYSQGSAGGTYTVRAGDSLQSIAQAIYGDSSLWYKIAEANGLSGANGLIQNQVLILPTGIIRSTNNTGTTNPYNPAEAIGDLSPTAPQPPKKAKNKCGVFGLILLAVVAIAVTVVTAGAALAAVTPGLSLGGGITAVLGGTATLASGAAFTGSLIGTFGVAGGLAVGAGAAMVGSIVSQGIGVATGIQDKFSWKSVAMAGIGSFVTAGLGQIAGGGGWLAAGARAAAGSAITQGIGVATGLQDKFDWAGVAAAGVGAAVGSLVGGDLPSLANNNTIGNYLAHFGTNAASMIANAATRSLINGNDFGDNIIAALPDVVAQTIGDLLFNGVGRSGPVSVEKFDARVAQAVDPIDDRIKSLESQRQAAIEAGDDQAVEVLDQQIDSAEIAREVEVSNVIQEMAIERYGIEGAINRPMRDIVPEGSTYVRFRPRTPAVSSGGGAAATASTASQDAAVDSDNYIELETITVIGYRTPSQNIDPDAPLGRAVVDGLAWAQRKVESWGLAAQVVLTGVRTIATGGAGPILSFALEQGVSLAIPHLPDAVLQPIARGGAAVEDFVGGGGGSILLNKSRESVVARDRSAIAWGASELIGVSFAAIAGLAVRYIARRARGVDTPDPEIRIGTHRPYIRVGVRRTVEARARAQGLMTADGRFIDPNTRRPIDGPYDLGHKPGREYWRLREYAISQNMTQAQFNNYVNNPDFYQIESPPSNRSHRYEKPK